MAADATENRSPRKPRFSLLAFAAGIGALGFGAIVCLSSLFWSNELPAEKAAYFTCKACVEAQEIYHRAIDGHYKDGQYASSLKELGQFPQALLQAEGRPSQAATPRAGYCYFMLTAQGQHANGGQLNYFASEDGVQRLTRGWALVAYPRLWGPASRKTFIVNKDGIVYSKDLGASGNAILDTITEFDPDESWTVGTFSGDAALSRGVEPLAVNGDSAAPALSTTPSIAPANPGHDRQGVNRKENNVTGETSQVVEGDEFLAVDEDHIYTLTIDSDAAFQIGSGPEKKVKSTTIFRYRRVQRKTKVLLYEISDSIMLYTDGKFERESSSDRIGMKKRTPTENTVDVFKRDADEYYQSYVEERYGTPFCTLTIDGYGHVCKQEMRKSKFPEMSLTTHPEIMNGMASNYQLFHGMFSVDKDQWTEEASFAGDSPVRGTLKYSKQPRVAGTSLVHVNVSGTMNTTRPLAGSDITINASVTGEQIYDTSIKQWLSGKLELKLSSSQQNGAKVPSRVTGVMTVSMDMVKDTK